MPAALITSRGAPLRLGRELGRGGEGAVYAIAGERGRVAKLYHRPPDARKQAKLAFMAAHAERRLLDYSAWPQETLHAWRGGPPVGFVMQEVAHRAAIHAVYSPAQRREEHPEAAWDFLLCVARNTAAAFAALHDHGHVLGDVNQSNVVVGRDGRVVLIDCDSFQVDAHGTLHRCDVGVAHFTAPELQGVAAFDVVPRSPNHDNFGLALLVFHLLFGGRHPYSGVPLRPGAGDALEADIRAFRYAYAHDARRRGLAGPPRALPIALIPASMEALFHRAFTEAGAAGERPTAQQWIDALDALRQRLRRCSGTRMHVFPEHLPQCPWCRLERQGVVHFVDARSLARADARAFVAQAWARIDAIARPPPIAPSVAAVARVAPAALPASVAQRDRLVRYRFFAMVLVLVLCALAPQAWAFALIAGAMAWSLARSFADAPLHAERGHRRAALARAQRECDTLLRAARSEAGPEGFVARKRELARLCEQYRTLAREARRSARHRARFAARRHALEAALRNGPAALTAYRQHAVARTAVLGAALDAAARRVAQAEADLAAL